MNNIELLFDILDNRSKGVAKANRSPPSSLFGQVDGAMNLTLDGISGQVPQGQYITSISLMPGDHVLVLHTEGEYIVISKVGG